MAVVSIAAKEWLFRYTRRWGRRVNSASVVANAWHHRSDSLSSVATLAGIAGSMFLGDSWRVLDPLAAMLVSVFIFVVAWRVGMPSVRELLEVSLPREVVEPMWRVIAGTPGVICFHNFRSRRNGSAAIIDFHIKVDPDITVVNAHEIATRVERELRQRFGPGMIINTHIEPYRGEAIDSGGQCASKS
jgi:cation diffusion facilitator family transporter